VTTGTTVTEIPSDDSCRGFSRRRDKDGHPVGSISRVSEISLISADFGDNPRVGALLPRDRALRINRISRRIKARGC